MLCLTMEYNGWQCPKEEIYIPLRVDGDGSAQRNCSSLILLTRLLQGGGGQVDAKSGTKISAHDVQYQL